MVGNFDIVSPMKVKELQHAVLTPFDRELLHVLELDCRTSLPAISERLGRPRQTVEYHLHRLLDAGVIRGFRTSFSPGKMGYHLYKIHVKLINISDEREKLISYLKKLGNVYWYGLTSGSWDLLIGLFYQHYSELFQVIEKLTTDFRSVVVDLQGYVPVVVLQYPSNYLTGHCSPPLEYVKDVTPANLKAVDYNIIAELVDDARIPVTEIASRLRTTPAIVRARMQKLEQAGILLHYRVDLDFKKLGLTYFKTLIEVHSFEEREYQRFIKYVSNIPQVIYFLRNLWSLELEIVIESFSAYEKLLEMLRKEFPKLIRKIDSLVIHYDEWTPGFRNILNPPRKIK